MAGDSLSQENIDHLLDQANEVLAEKNGRRLGIH